MTGDLVMHRLGALDLDRASALHRDAFEPMGERGWTRQDIAELLASPGVAGVVLTAGAVDVGMAIWRVAADEAELLTIAVAHERRRLGAGRLLLNAVIKQARVVGATTLFLEVGSDNPAARALYEAAGFNAVGRRKAYYLRGDRPAADALIMRLNLN